MKITEEGIKKDLVRLFKIQPFLGMIMLKQKIKIENCGTAYVDGVSLGIDPEFWEGLNLKQRITLLAHEAYHLTNLHNFRQNNRDPQLFNQACDYAINAHLQSDIFEFPPEGCTNPELLEKFKNSSAESIYDYLNKPAEKPKEQSTEEEQTEEGKQEEEKEQKQKQSTEGKQESETETEPVQKTESFGEVRPHPKKDEDGVYNKEKRNLRKMIAQAKANGTLPVGATADLDASEKPKCDWRMILQRWVDGKSNSDYNSLHPNPVHLPNFVLPSLSADGFANIAVCVDTSGSMSDKEIKQGLAEIKRACEVFQENGQECEINVVFADSRVQSVQKMSDPSDVLIPKGRGGTYFTPAIEKCSTFTDPPSGIIYITDGYGNDVPERACADILFLVTEFHGLNYLKGQLPRHCDALLINRTEE